jgi:hypothetical protein
MTKERGVSMAHRPRLREVLVVLTMIYAGACITGTRRGYPLYPHPPLMEQQRVAFLTGYIHDVDGKDVSQHGRSFDLLPGCHIVGTPEKGGTMDSTAGVVITTGSRKFAIPMKAAHSYVIEVGSPTAFSGITGPASLSGREIDEAGKTTRRFAPAASLPDVQDCMKEAQR